jgi:hypothetical protein
MSEENNDYINLTIMSKPFYIQYFCKKCNDGREILYDDYVKEFDEPRRLSDSIIRCERCKHTYKVKDIEWIE